MNDETSAPGAQQPSSSPSAANKPALKEGWEKDLLERLVFASLREQRSKRRWGIFFRLATLFIVLFIIAAAFDLKGGDIEAVKSHTALIEIQGTIAPGDDGSADAVLPALNRAFSDAHSVGVILRINSPGGSPVQAGIINDEIQRLRKAHPKKPLHVVVDDMCASGGYYVAVAADHIYVNKASIIGSIGVLMNGFGVTGLMEKIGVERRTITAGDNKAFMDPFAPESEKQRQYAQGLLNEIHQQFIDVVRKGRGKRLKETPDMFSGLFWSGAKAVELGLADGFGSVESVARDVFKAEDIVDYTQHEGLSDRVLKRFGAAAGESAIKTLSKQATDLIR